MRSDRTVWDLLELINADGEVNSSVWDLLELIATDGDGDVRGPVEKPPPVEIMLDLVGSGIKNPQIVK